MSEKFDVTDLPSVDAISSFHVRLPPFRMSDPVLWFRQIELALNGHNIRSELRRYEMVASLLPDEVADEVRDLILEPPADDPYATLKQAVIKRFSVSDRVRMQKLMSNVHLGDRSPSQLLRHMRTLAPRGETIMFAELWMQRLPQDLQQILAAHEGTVDLDALASIADRIHERASVRSSVQTVREDDRIAILEKKLDELSVSLLSKSRGSNRQDAFRRPPSTSPKRHKLCWYHEKYGDKAHRCIPPCFYSAKPFSHSGNGSTST